MLREACILAGQLCLLCLRKSDAVGHDSHICHGNALQPAVSGAQIMMAVLARGYDWQVDLTEPIKSFPIPTPIRGMPMTFSRI